MAKSKNTKRALLASILSLMLCAAMLVGSTFAWFTDSVTSGVNKIVAGNLDVELEYSTNGTDWKPVGIDTNLFKSADETLWEPGHTEYVYLRVRNAGTLALKYQFSLNVYGDENGAPENTYTGVLTEADGATHKTFKLSEYLVFNQTEGQKDISKREDLWIADPVAEKDAMGNLNGLGKTNELLAPGAEQILTLAVYMPTQVGNEANQLTSAKADEGEPTIFFGLNLEAGQAESEEDSFSNDYDKMSPPVVYAGTRNEFVNALKNGDNVVLNDDITLTISATTITKDTTIDLNGHTLSGAKYKSALDVKNATVTIKNGIVEATPNAAGSALYAEGESNVIVENCTIKSNDNKTYAVCTNGSKSLDTTIVIRNSTISAPNVAGRKGYALYAPAGNITFENCDVTGHIFISGGNVTLDGGTYTATGFNGQAQIWNEEDTMDYVSKMTGGSAYTMGDSIFIADRRDGYTLSSVTIRNITFNTEITLKDGTKATAYAIKYVDMNGNGATSRVPYVIENNTFNNKINYADPVMYIDLGGNDITNP